MGPRPALLLAAILTTLLGLIPLASATPGVRRVGAHAPRRSLADGQLIDGTCPARYPRCIAFTFDDGPEHATTPRLLDMLDAYHVRATFFVVGHRIEGDEPHHALNRAALRETARRGHLIGNHTFNHVELDYLRPAALASEIDRTATLITQVTGHRPQLFRAPFGEMRRPRTVNAVAARHYTPAFWAIDTHDWEVFSAREVAENFRHSLDESPRGGVVLMHDTRPWSVSAFPAIMLELSLRNKRLVARGEAPYQIITLDEMVVPRGAEPLRGRPVPHPRQHRHHDAR